MTKFEYATLVFDVDKLFTGSLLDHDKFQRKLNEYGSDGWELVSVFGLNRGEGKTHEITAVFKRPRT